MLLHLRDRTPTGSTGWTPGTWREDKPTLTDAPLPDRADQLLLRWARSECIYYTNNKISLPFVRVQCLTHWCLSLLFSQSDFKEIPYDFRRQADPAALDIQGPMEKLLVHRWSHRVVSLMVIFLFLHIPQNKKHKIALYWINWDIKEQIHLSSGCISHPRAPSIAACCQRNKKED